MRCLPRTNPNKSVKEQFSESRSCYGHLAGKIGVFLHNYLLENSIIEFRDGLYLFSKNAATSLSRVAPLSSEFLTLIGKPCFDATERCIHLGGSMGKFFLELLVDSNWVKWQSGSRLISLESNFDEFFDLINSGLHT